MNRKIIQISSVNILGRSTDESCNYKIIALCNDGTLWEKMFDAFNGGYGQWYQIDPIEPTKPSEHNS